MPSATRRKRAGQQAAFGPIRGWTWKETERWLAEQAVTALIGSSET
jgi:hypothetical protein